MTHFEAVISFIDGFIQTSHEASASLILHLVIIFSIGDHLGLIRMQCKRAIVLHNHNLLNKLYWVTIWCKPVLVNVDACVVAMATVVQTDDSCT